LNCRYRQELTLAVTAAAGRSWPRSDLSALLKPRQ
jgi:hypothetical protein